MAKDKAPPIEEQVATMQVQIAAQQKIIEDQQNRIAELSQPKGITSAKEKAKPKVIVLTTEQQAERELRRYIKNAGARYSTGINKGKVIKPGFRKNLSEEKKERTRKLLKILGRTEMKWDEELLDFRNHLPPVTGDQQ
jgi:hypothetical protein